jgi:CheY-like chemotaxis protein
MEAIGTLAGGIAHEFNNILGIIIGNTELARDDIPEENPAADCIQEIRTASLRAKDVVQKLLSVSRKTPASRKPIQIRTIVDESLGFLRKTIPASIEIRTKLVCATEMILADPTQISQVLMNLSSNSAHAMIDGNGVLEVTLETKTIDSRSPARSGDIGPGDYVRLAISDDGTGIPADILDRIFDPYFTTKDVDEGLGMGLAVVHGIVNEHDGVIKIESEVEKGTTVEVLFPLIKEQSLESVENADSPLTGVERILFVDDESSLVKMVTEMLNRAGYAVLGKTNSPEALKIFKENPERFDLVITDMGMPDMAGDELAKQIIQVRPDIPIILCTGHSDHMDENRALELGIRAFAMKPLTKSDLAKTVRKVLDERDD